MFRFEPNLKKKTLLEWLAQRETDQLRKRWKRNETNDLQNSISSLFLSIFFSSFLNSA